MARIKATYFLKPVCLQFKDLRKPVSSICPLNMVHGMSVIEINLCKLIMELVFIFLILVDLIASLLQLHWVSVNISVLQSTSLC